MLKYFMAADRGRGKVKKVQVDSTELSLRKYLQDAMQDRSQDELMHASNHNKVRTPLQVRLLVEVSGQRRRC